MSSASYRSTTERQGIGERRWALYLSYVVLFVFIAAFLVPPSYAIITSLKTVREISSPTANPWLVGDPTLSNYTELLAMPSFRRFFLNSMTVSVIVTALTLLISIPAGFGIARLRFWGSETLSTAVFLTYLVPASLLFIPLFQIVGFFGLLNSTWALVLVLPTLTVPFATWIMIGAMKAFPEELHEAGLIDGATHIQVLTHICLPVILPALVAAAIFSFSLCWGQFLYPMAFLFSNDQQVLTVGITSELIKGDVFQWGKLMAAIVVTAIPPILIFSLLMEYYISGLTAGATKG